MVHWNGVSLAQAQPLGAFLARLDALDPSGLSAPDRINHAFLSGHRLMVQVQSSWFPLYDRNPQSWVDNIFLARPSDYRAATIDVALGGTTPSAVVLPVVQGE